MQSKLLSSLRGYVRIEVVGKNTEALLNKATERHYAIWDIQFVGEKTVTMHILLKDFFRLRPLLKETGCRMRVKERFGFPFWVAKLGRRKFFAVGLAGFLIGIYLLSSLVWQVNVQGNEQIPEEQILKAASEQGIYPFQWKFRLKEPDVLSKRLQAQLPGTAWVGVEIHGTHVLIKVVEAKLPDPRPLLGPRNLVATKNALITEIFAEKGRPMVQPNRYVRKGDLLISGVVGEAPNQQTVIASGTVKGLVWYTSQIEVPLVQTYKTYTGESKSRSYLVIGNRALQITGYGKLPFEQSETIPDRKVFRVRNWVLPVGWLHEKVMAVKLEERPIDVAEAKKIGLQQGRTEVLAAAGKDAKVQTEKILHEKTENGKVYMEVHFEVEENIAQEQPIVPQGE
jgi:similar to stage IV sporulation protein